MFRFRNFGSVCLGIYSFFKEYFNFLVSGSIFWVDIFLDVDVSFGYGGSEEKMRVLDVGLRLYFSFLLVVYVGISYLIFLSYSVCFWEGNYKIYRVG